LSLAEVQKVRKPKGLEIGLDRLKNGRLRLTCRRKPKEITMPELKVLAGMVGLDVDEVYGICKKRHVNVVDELGCRRQLEMELTRINLITS
jgi:hypothetical protein